MSGIYSGFITQIIYASISHGQDQTFELLTEDGEVILTESGLPIEIEH